MSMNWRLASRLSVVVLAILVVLLVTIWQQRINAAKTINTSGASNSAVSSDGLQGTDLGGTPAPDFRLTDQYGKQVSLSQFKGKPVVVTFLYTHCPDVCPLTAEKLHTTLQDLGSEAQNVGVLAVSTDPKGDTVDAALQFSKAHRLQDSWHFLVGPESTLAPIWSNYSVYAQTQQMNINHTLAVYLIDKQGRERVFLGDDFVPTQLAANLKILLKE